MTLGAIAVLIGIFGWVALSVRQSMADDDRRKTLDAIGLIHARKLVTAEVARVNAAPPPATVQDANAIVGREGTCERLRGPRKRWIWSVRAHVPAGETSLAPVAEDKVEFARATAETCEQTAAIVGFKAEVPTVLR